MEAKFKDRFMVKFLFRTALILLIVATVLLIYGLLLPQSWPTPASSAASMRFWCGITCMGASR
jgi:predicted permease